MINVNEFLGMTTDKASVKPPLIPVNSEGYPAQIMNDGVDLKPFKYKTGERAGTDGYRMTVKWELTEEEIRAKLKSQSRAPITTQSIMINFLEGGALAPENTGLRNLRDAVNQNQNGKPWQPAMLIGQTARIFIGHRIDDKGEEQEEVQRVTKL